MKVTDRPTMVYRVASPPEKVHFSYEQLTQLLSQVNIWRVAISPFSKEFFVYLFFQEILKCLSKV